MELKGLLYGVLWGLGDEAGWLGAGGKRRVRALSCFLSSWLLDTPLSAGSLSRSWFRTYLFRMRDQAGWIAAGRMPDIDRLT